MPSIESNIVLIDQYYGNNHYNITMVDVQKDVIIILLICMWLEMIATEITHVRVNMTHEFGGFIYRSLQPCILWEEQELVVMIWPTQNLTRLAYAAAD